MDVLIKTIILVEYEYINCYLHYYSKVWGNNISAIFYNTLRKFVGCSKLYWDLTMDKTYSIYEYTQ